MNVWWRNSAAHVVVFHVVVFATTIVSVNHRSTDKECLPYIEHLV